MKEDNKNSFKSIKIDLETFEELDRLCDRIGETKSNFIRGMVRFFQSNKTLITADFFFKKKSKNKIITKDRKTIKSSVESFQKEIEKNIQKLVQKETNRVISFLKVQDKFLLDMKEDFYSKLNKDSQEENFHPLFNHMDLVLKNIEEYLQAKNGETFEDVFEFLKEKAGEKRGEYFMRSLKNVREKTLKY